ncbi:MAG: hypothetical protein ACI4F8_11190 [Lachnospiraceae bacterium]
MNYYSLYGSIIKTDLDFPQLLSSSSTDYDIIIQNGPMPEFILEFSKSVSYDFGPDSSFLSNRTCYFHVTNGNTITYQAKENANIMYLKTYILGYGVSMLFLQRNQLAIHCSAVSNEKGALLICGESGYGKSTLTSHLLEIGYTLMADDMAIIAKNREGNTDVYPAFPFQKLSRDIVEAKKLNYDDLIYIDEDKDKFLVPYQGDFSISPIPLRGIITLSLLPQDCDVQTTPVTGLDCLHTYTENLFLRHLLGNRKYVNPIGPLCFDFMNAAPIWNIARPVNRNTLSQVLHEIDRIVLGQ